MIKRFAVDIHTSTNSMAGVLIPSRSAPVDQ